MKKVKARGQVIDSNVDNLWNQRIMGGVTIRDTIGRGQKVVITTRAPSRIAMVLPKTTIERKYGMI